MKPRWMRRHVACPECGQIYGIDGDANPKGELDLNKAMPPKLDPKTGTLIHPEGFTCLKCHAHFSVVDFWDENKEKWNREFKPEDSQELSKREFIGRLKEAGWSDDLAEKEWKEIQSDEEGNP